MKKLLTVFSSMLLVLALSACTTKINEESQKTPATSSPTDNTTGNSNMPSSSTGAATQDAVTSASPLRRPIDAYETETVITQEQAILIALEKAGLTLSDVYGIAAEYDAEEDKSWEIEFKYDGYEYSYEINAVTEAIIESEKEPIDYD